MLAVLVNGSENLYRYFGILYVVDFGSKVFFPFEVAGK